MRSHLKMKDFLIIGLIVIVGIMLVIGLNFKHMHDIAEFMNPSQTLEQSIKKKVLIDSFKIINPSTVRINNFGQLIDILPTSSWIEKRVFWKSRTMDLDSLDFYPDSVELMVNFKNYVNGEPWKPQNNGYGIGLFQNINGDKQSVYIDDNMTQLNFKMNINELKDTIRLKTNDHQQIILKRVN